MRFTTLMAIAALAIAAEASAQGKLNVMTTTEDLAAIARDIGGDRVTVDSIAKGYQDPHFVEAKPSFILKLQKADVLILVGRELEIGWLPPLIQQSRNSKVQVGADGYVDASLKARILEVPQPRSRALKVMFTPWAILTIGWTRKTRKSSDARSPMHWPISGRMTAPISRCA